MPRLTTRQKNRIIAEYVDGDGRVTQAQLAQKYNCTQKTIFEKAEVTAFSFAF